MNVNRSQDDISLTMQIPETIYKTFRAYQERFAPHKTIDALIVESLMAEVSAAHQEIEDTGSVSFHSWVGKNLGVSRCPCRG